MKPADVGRAAEAVTEALSIEMAEMSTVERLALAEELLRRLRRMSVELRAAKFDEACADEGDEVVS